MIPTAAPRTHRPSSLDLGGFAGLSEAEARLRLEREGPNELPSAKPRTLLRQAWESIRQPMLLLLLGAGTVNFLIAEPLDGAILMSFVVVVIGISIYQEHKTENALVALRDLSSPRAAVVRDGRVLEVVSGFAPASAPSAIAPPVRRQAARLPAAEG